MFAAILEELVVYVLRLEVVGQFCSKKAGFSPTQHARMSLKLSSEDILDLHTCRMVVAVASFGLHLFLHWPNLESISYKSLESCFNAPSRPNSPGQLIMHYIEISSLIPTQTQSSAL